jgi:hypothetical protein
MFWFDKADDRCLFVDNRVEDHTVTDRSHGKARGTRSFSVRPDVLASFEALPFADDSFPLVVFDPPHINHGGRGYMVKKYGRLNDDWREVLRRGFSECFRVLIPLGTLIFKWSECDISVNDVLALTPNKPLLGQRCGAKARTHWIVFQKDEATSTPTRHSKNVACDSRWCPAWGELREGEHSHTDCPVVVDEDNAGEVARPSELAGKTLPVVCPCECSTCSRAWASGGMPILRGGEVIRYPDFHGSSIGK